MDAVADPGFPWGGGVNSPGGANIRYCQIFPKTAWNWMNLDHQAGGARPSRPLSSATGMVLLLLHECSLSSVDNQRWGWHSNPTCCFKVFFELPDLTGGGDVKLLEWARALILVSFPLRLHPMSHLVVIPLPNIFCFWLSSLSWYILKWVVT